MLAKDEAKDFDEEERKEMGEIGQSYGAIYYGIRNAKIAARLIKTAVEEYNLGEAVKTAQKDIGSINKVNAIMQALC